MPRFPALITAAGVAALSWTSVDVAFAACTRLAFSVNDYGKVGPTNDAKNLLDKYIAKWTADRKITAYKTGPKDVTCDLFLDFKVFDEYTCKAAATVCWDGPLPPGHTTEAGAASPFYKASQSAPGKAKSSDGGGAEAGNKAAAPIATGSVKGTPARASSGAPPAPARVVAPVRTVPSEAAAPPTPAAAPAAPAPAASD